MGSSTGNSDKESTKTGRDGKIERSWEKNGKDNTRKITVQLEEINQKVQAKEGRLKRYRPRIKQYRQNRTFKNNERKFYQ